MAIPWRALMNRTVASGRRSRSLAEHDRGNKMFSQKSGLRFSLTTNWQKLRGSVGLVKSLEGGKQTFATRLWCNLAPMPVRDYLGSLQVPGNGKIYPPILKAQILF